MAGYRKNSSDGPSAEDKAVRTYEQQTTIRYQVSEISAF